MVFLLLFLLLKDKIFRLQNLVVARLDKSELILVINVFYLERWRIEYIVPFCYLRGHLISLLFLLIEVSRILLEGILGLL